MKNLRFCAIFGAVLLPSAAGALQTPPPPPPPPPAPPPSSYDMRHPNADTFTNEYTSKVQLSFKNRQAEADVMARKVAGCVAERGGSDAGALVGGTMTEDTNYEALTKALKKKFRTCVTDDAVGVPMNLINAALAEDLVRAANPGLQDRVPPSDPAAAKAFYASGGGVTMDSLGRCLAAYSPGLAYRVLAAPAGTPGETQAMSALFAQTPECGVGKPPATIPAAEQRSAVATGLFHWIHRG